MHTGSSRRQFLRGRWQHDDVIRPPWATARFTDQCRRCGLCVEQCQTNLLINGSGGFPEADFSQAHCTFCGQCVAACEHGTLSSDQQKPWTVVAQINNLCLALNRIHCRTCEEFCEPQAINFQLRPGGLAEPTINSELCTGCGECFGTCPARAMEMKPL